MEVEDEYKLLQRLFFKKYGRALPKKKSDEVDLGMDRNDLTEEQDKLDAIPTLAQVDITKKESIEIPKAIIHAVNQAKTVEFLTPKWISQDKVACFSLKQAPSRRKSEMQKMSSKQKSLLRVDIKSPSDDASQNGTSVQNSWRLNLEEFIDSIRAAAKRKPEMKFPNDSSRREWRTMHQRTKEIINTLIRISEHLERIEMNKTTVEVTSYLNCASHLTKIIPEMLENLTAHFVPDKVYFCESPPKPMGLIELTKEEDKKREDDTPSIQVPLPVVRKTKPIEIVTVRKSLRKSDVIPEKEIPEDIIAQKFVRELFFSNFCESPTNQEEDDKGRKDAADHTASAGASKKMAKPKVNQRQRRIAQKAKATAAALTGLPAAPTTGIKAVHKIVLPTAHGRQSGMSKQVEVVIKHYHFYQPIVAWGSVIPPGIPDMSVPPPATVLSKTGHCSCCTKEHLIPECP
jgi:hypothetical protein